MRTTCLYIGDRLPLDTAMQLLMTHDKVVWVTVSDIDLEIDAVDRLSLHLGSIEGQTRLLDWFRQADTPRSIFCELSTFGYIETESSEVRSATDYLQTQIVGVTRALEAALSLNPALMWSFICPLENDVWSRACEDYFRALSEGLSVAAPEAQFTFVSDGQLLVV